MTQLMEPRTQRRHRYWPRLRSVASPEESVEATVATVDDDAETPAEVERPPVPRWRRVVPGLAIAAIAMSYVYASVPFTFANAIECRQSVMSGATVAPGTPAGTIVGDMGRRCAETGSSRVAVAATAAAAAGVVGLAGAFAPTAAEVGARRGRGPDDGEELLEDFWPDAGNLPVPHGPVGVLSVEELAEILGELPEDFPMAARVNTRFEVAEVDIPTQATDEPTEAMAIPVEDQDAPAGPIAMGPAPDATPVVRAVEAAEKTATEAETGSSGRH